MSTTPTTPQWAIEAAKCVYHACFGVPATTTQASQESVALLAKKIAKHAPPLSPPTDEAKLREVIRDEIQWAKYLSASGMIASEHQITTLTDRILIALAPHPKAEPNPLSNTPHEHPTYP